MNQMRSLLSAEKQLHLGCFVVTAGHNSHSNYSDKHFAGYQMYNRRTCRCQQKSIHLGVVEIAAATEPGSENLRDSFRIVVPVEFVARMAHNLFVRVQMFLVELFVARIYYSIDCTDS